MKSSVLSFTEYILKEGERLRFRNERRRFSEFIETLTVRYPQSISEEKTLIEPYRSLTFLVIVGQRPITSLLLLEILLETGKAPLNGKQIGEKIAEKLKAPPSLTTKGGNYKDRVGDLLSAFIKIGIIELFFSDQHDPPEEGYRLRESAIVEVEAFLAYFKKGGLLSNLKPMKLEEMFHNRFDEKIKYVIKSGSEERQRFSIGKILKSLLNPKLGISFETAVRVIEQIETELKKDMNTLEIQSILHEVLKREDERAAENYRFMYPEILSMAMSDGEARIVNYKLVKTLIKKEAKLKLTRSLLDQFASTLYNVMTRNPAIYQKESSVREYVNALIHSECVHVRSRIDFATNHLERAKSTIEGCRNSLQSDELNKTRDLFKQFLEQICLVSLTLFGYLPFKNLKDNVDLISNLLKQETVKKELYDDYQLKEEDILHFQRIKYLMQKTDTASQKSLEKMLEVGQRITDLCSNVLQHFDTRKRVKTRAVETLLDIPSTQSSTGYADLDNLMAGGIPEGYAIILTSPSCDERDLLIVRYLETGAENGQITFHITIDAYGTETLAEEFPSNFYLFMCNPEAETIAKTRPNILKLKGVENLTQISISLNNVLRQISKKDQKPRRACIEIVSDILLQHHALSTRRWLTSIISILKSAGFTTLAVINPHMHSSQEVQAILDLFQGEIDIFMEKTDKGLKKFLRIVRMYNVEYIEHKLPIKKDKIRKRNTIKSRAIE